MWPKAVPRVSDSESPIFTSSVLVWRSQYVGAAVAISQIEQRRWIFPWRCCGSCGRGSCVGVLVEYSAISPDATESAKGRCFLKYRFLRCKRNWYYPFRARFHRNLPRPRPPPRPRPRGTLFCPVSHYPLQEIKNSEVMEPPTFLHTALHRNWAYQVFKDPGHSYRPRGGMRYEHVSPSVV